MNSGGNAITNVCWERWGPGCDGHRYCVWVRLRWGCTQTNGCMTSFPDICMAVVDDFGRLVEVK